MKSPVATGLIQHGTLKVGDIIISDRSFCRVRSLTDHKGQSIKFASPSTPVEISGWKEEPEIGTEILQILDEKIAKEIIDYRVRLYETCQIDQIAKSCDETRMMNEEIKAEIRNIWLNNPERIMPNVFEAKRDDSKPSMNVVVKCKNLRVIFR